MAPIVFSGDAGAAPGRTPGHRWLVITVAGVTFSVTITALQLTSTQFSPRVLRNFIGDRVNQSVLAAFLATFAYSIMVLGNIPRPQERRKRSSRYQRSPAPSC